LLVSEKLIDDAPQALLPALDTGSLVPHRDHEARPGLIERFDAGLVREGDTTIGRHDILTIH
jgi:hypothetical protein